jgi:peptidoglycan/xylan/chitin deacetylase (PgdA/CDA1 family)
MTPRRWKDRAFQLAEHLGMLNLLHRLDDGQRLYVLNYHRVDDPAHRPWLDPSLISASPVQLEAQFRLLAEKYTPVSAEEVLAALEGVRRLPKRAVLVSVDDGYRDFKETIFPAAQRYGIRPVLFVPTAYVGEGMFWWDRLYAAVMGWPGDQISGLGQVSDLPLRTAAERQCALNILRGRLKQLPFVDALHFVDELSAGSRLKRPEQAEPDTLDWDELRALSQAGATIAAHTHTHPLLSRIPFEQACAEIRTSQALIQQEISPARTRALPVFAIPDGKPEFFTPALLEFLRAEGYRFVVTTIEGSARLTSSLALRYPRLGVWPRLTLAAFHYHLTPAYPLPFPWLKGKYQPGGESQAHPSGAG